MKEVFKTLNEINVNKHTEKKQGLTYLSWAWAWAEVKKIYSDATYQTGMYDGKPYIFDEKLGYMVFTSVCIEGETLAMWLPVMDGANKAMLDKPYTYKVKDWAESNIQGKEVMKEKTCNAATMFDINKTIMRCLVKNIAMFGLGLYLYAGEDLPEEIVVPEEKPTLTEEQFEKAMTGTKEQIQTVLNKFSMTTRQSNALNLLL